MKNIISTCNLAARILKFTLNIKIYKKLAKNTFWSLHFQSIPVLGPKFFFLPLLVPILKNASVLVPAVTHLTEISYVANGPTVNASVSIKIILKNIYLHF